MHPCCSCSCSCRLNQTTGILYIFFHGTYIFVKIRNHVADKIRQQFFRGTTGYYRVIYLKYRHINRGLAWLGSLPIRNLT